MANESDLFDSLGEMPGAGGLEMAFEGGGAQRPAPLAPSAHPPDAPGDDAPLAMSLLYSSGSLGAGVFYAFNNFILPIFLGALQMPVILIGLLSSTRSFEGAVVQPIVGAWSDRTWTRFGRRKPFILACVPISVFFILLTPFLPDVAAFAPLAGLPHALGLSRKNFVLLIVALGIFFFTLAFNIMYDPYQALLADITPLAHRGRVNGIFQALGAFGQALILIIGAFLSVSMTGLFLLTGIALATFFVPTLLGVREPRRLPGIREQHRYTTRDYWNGLRADPQVQLYFATQFFLWFGINAITPFLTLYATNEAHFDVSHALILSFILLLSSAIFNVPFGLLGDRLGMKRIFFFGMLCLAGAAVAGSFTKEALPLYLILTVAGIGNAAQTASSYPLLTRIVQPDQMGLYTGLASTVTSIAAPASALITGALIQGIGYTAMFPFVAALFLASLVPLALLRPERAVAARVRATTATTAAPLMRTTTPR